MMMYDRFVENDELSSDDLLDLDLDEDDLSKFVEQGQLKIDGNGNYTVASSDQMLFLVKYFVDKGNNERADKVLYRAKELFPNNQRVASRVFADAVFDSDYDRAFENLDMMMETPNKHYIQDQNFWLYLLSLITEVPDKYKEKVKKMSFEDVCVLPTDHRYKNRKVTNEVRKAILKFSFKKAIDKVVETPEHKEKIFASTITMRLLYEAKEVNRNQRDEYLELIKDGNYLLLANELLTNSQIRKFSFNEICALMLTNDLISITQYKTLPKREHENDFYGDFYKSIYDCDYVSTLKNNVGVTAFGEIFEKLLENIIVEYNKLLAVQSDDDNVSVEENNFYNIILGLMNNDVDKALGYLDNYLEMIGKSEYKNFVSDLIKLDELSLDNSFDESILALAKIKDNYCDFSVDAYVTDFYHQLYGKNYKKAAIFLDLISMASLVGDVAVDIAMLKKSLLAGMHEDGIDESSLGIFVENKENDNSNQLSYLPDIFYDVVENKNLVMLAPLEEEEAAKVVEIAKNIPCVFSIVVDEPEGKRLFFRYLNKNEGCCLLRENLISAAKLYNICDYQGCIDVYESILPKLDEPRPFIYERLGYCYYQTAQDNDFTKAINYLSLANSIGVEGDSLDSIINGLKRDSLYDGIKINADEDSGEFSLGGEWQYKKEK